MLLETLCLWNVICNLNSLINKLYICENLASILVIDSNAISVFALIFFTYLPESQI
jgi:hypothetical protein